MSSFTALNLRVSILLDVRTVTIVALIEWLVKYGEIPALVVMFLSIFLRVLWQGLTGGIPNCTRNRAEFGA